MHNCGVTDTEPGLPEPAGLPGHRGDNEAARGDDTGEAGHSGSARHSQGIDAAGLIAAIAAAVAAIVVLRVTYSRIFTAALFIVAGAAIAVVWLAGASRLPWFRNCLATAVVLALGGAGIYFVAFPDSNPHQTMQAIAPALNFELESPAMVPWCSAYTVSTDGALPHGYQVLMFDSSAGQQGDPVGLFTFDGAATAVPRTHDEWTVKDVFIGDKYRKDKNGNYLIRGGKYVSEAGFKAVVTVVLMANRYAEILEHVAGQPQLTSLPPRLESAQLEVTRQAGHVAICEDLLG
jgi:hypothetical protein